MTDFATPKQRPGFKPGQSGNPSGKPKGTRNRLTRLLDEAAEEGAAAVLEVVLGAAKAGDLRAAELVLSRVWPVPKGRPTEITLPAIQNGRDIPDAMVSVVAAQAGGEITGDEAAAMIGSLDSLRRAFELGELAQRIAALEARLAP
jgi:hypothetical protein